MADDEVDLVGRLMERARRDVESGWLPACQVAVARHGELVAFETFGAATAAHRFLAYSTTKPIVASCVWHHLADGSLDLAAPVTDYVPELTGVGPVTVEQVLLHTSGFPNAPMTPTEGADATRRRARFGTWRTEWEPGTRFEYHAASAHWVLADIIERLDGGDFRDVIERRVTGPLGLPRVLGLPADAQHDIALPVLVGEAASAAAAGAPPTHAELISATDVIAAGIPGGGAVMTAADLACFYQCLLHNPDELWRPDVLADATGTIRCRLPEPLFGVPVNRSLGLVIAGDDGQHIMRYAGFGQACSPAAFGHAGMHMQVAWADPATGVSFAYLTNGVDADVMAEGTRGVALSNIASRIGRATER